MFGGGAAQASQSAATWPEASNTGVPPGVTLTIVNGNLSSSSNSQVIDALDVRGDITVTHTNVTIKRCKAFHIIGQGSGMIVQDSELNGQNQLTSLACIEIGNDVGASNSQVLRCNIWNCENGINLTANVNPTLIQDCYFHDHHNDAAPDPHIDGVVVWPGCSNTTIRHCNFDMLTTASSCMTSADANIILVDNCRMKNGTSIQNWDGTYSSNSTVQNCILYPMPNFPGGPGSYFDDIGQNNGARLTLINNTLIKVGNG